MFARLSFIRECGISTVGSNARPALRMRVNMSEIGSVIKLPAGFHNAGDQTVQRGLPEGEARRGELAQITAPAAAGRAAVHQPRWAGVARQLRETGVVAPGLQFRADRGVFFYRFSFALVALNPCFLGHKIYYFSASGKPMSFSKSSASASLRALVTTVTSIPCVRLILSNSISGKIVCSAMPNV